MQEVLLHSLLPFPLCVFNFITVVIRRLCSLLLSFLDCSYPDHLSPLLNSRLITIHVNVVMTL